MPARPAAACLPVGLALGAALLGLPWRLTGVMLAGSLEYHTQQQQDLVGGFLQRFVFQPEVGGSSASDSIDAEGLRGRVAASLRWAERARPRKFGKVLPGEIARCRAIAQRQGILTDPIWTLAAWEAAEALAAEQHEAGGGETVVMLHTGGMLGLCGLAQRYPNDF